MAKTQAQWMAEALAEMKMATWKPERWCAAIQEGYPPGHEYNWMATHNYKAQVAMWNAAHPAPAPAPTPLPPAPAPGVNPQALYVVFCAEDPGHALNAPAKYTIAYSADLEYRYPTEKRPDLDLRAIIADAKRRGHRTAGWCDCRPSGGTPAEVGVEFVRDYGLDYFIGQAESSTEFDYALNAGAKVMVGNITALYGEQVAMIDTHDIGFIQEDYWNEGWARASHPLIAAYCAGVYPTTLWPEPGAKITNYRQAGRWRDGDGIYYARPDTDWENLT